MSDTDTAPPRTRVTTRTGDRGRTGLGMGARVSKADPRVEAYGTVDEANSAIGLLRTMLAGRADRQQLDARLRAIQVDLFNVAADLSMPGAAGDDLRLTAAPMERIEVEMDAMNEALPRLANFILPTGQGMAAAQAHVARTVVRRAERRLVRLMEAEPDAVNPEVLRYLNRLADYCFVLARHLNDKGAADDVWAPRGLR
ncbi:ATP:cob(I)alamin adenosyltransferase [Rhodothalassium salexigens DSM 2132]|uniref:Corrinoid adenosyltransferase n=1 Tax=Rhodothalassium salexigens DSM 2132 TaxID=1188247 RepID=A0A4R2PIN0_RHOSA|nr:cob(I)yrinic acid a,c-diamide adenosyltransferase [Rhodothalassium salexigens]MBB4211413.1 cob(I)alamin adenosyltransferase [Rhodothalassium salexigens DSM 2132]MBK1637746.1 ATP:cob(I)alamin adenosyltransferase [Rhodothalassium salexigens DSM 2132]TCP35333.1 ATP:cob(I)alamin adenosyltransferase [Rhodothalassium salexigens DSM 2132]